MSDFINEIIPLKVVFIFLATVSCRAIDDQQIDRSDVLLSMPQLNVETQCRGDPEWSNALSGFDFEGIDETPFSVSSSIESPFNSRYQNFSIGALVFDSPAIAISLDLGFGGECVHVVTGVSREDIRPIRTNELENLSAYRMSEISSIEFAIQQRLERCSVLDEHSLEFFTDCEAVHANCIPGNPCLNAVGASAVWASVFRGVIEWQGRSILLIAFDDQFLALEMS